MKWYTGGIAEAVSASKSIGAIFVVYIQGTDDQSKRLTQSIENGPLGKGLENKNFVAIKVEAGSLSHQQFSEIFREPSVPSIYFIGKSGVPLDIIKGNDNLDNVEKRIGDILVKEGKPVPKTETVSAAASISANLIQNEQAIDNSNKVVCENGVCTIRTDVPGPSKDDGMQNEEKANAQTPLVSKEPQTKEPTHDEKLERAKELLEKKRLEKKQEEKEKEKQAEIERRNVGQGIQHLKKWQDDQELKQLKEDREKEKRDNQLARERVLAQIAQDKAERLARSQANSASPIETPKPVAPQSQPKPSSSTSRLQFKLPDGSSILQEFSVSDTLQSVINFVETNWKTNTDFRLSTVFPRREFTQNDYSQTLLDLQLFPNTVILVLPIQRGAVVVNRTWIFSDFIYNLFVPLINIFSYVKNWVFGASAPAGGNKRPSDGGSDNGPKQPPNRMNRGGSTVLRKQGNIHRLTDRRDSDDDGNTWNGNSTQQM